MAAPLIEEDDTYASSEDSDFILDGQPQADNSDQSDVDSEPDDNRPAKRRRTADAAQDDAADYENSGDEAIIKKGEKKKKKKRKDKAGEDAEDEDDGGEGGLIKTRRQRAQEKEEKKVAKATGPVTIDVDAVYKQMLAGNAPIPAPSEPTGSPSPSPEPEADPSDTILIKRTYTFAGKLHTESKLVSRTSAEAKLYLSQNPTPPSPTRAAPTKRTTKKAFRSIFEPAGELLQRSDLNLSMQARRDAAKKLNVVEKSRMDWAGYVDKEGIKDELDAAGRSKESYNAREEFLARSEAKRDGDARKARLAGRVL